MRLSQTLTLLCAGILTFSACKKEEKTSPPKETDTSFTGVWNVNSVRSTSLTDEIVTKDTTEIYAKGEWVISFSEDKTYTWVNTTIPYSETGSYILDSNTISMTSGLQHQTVTYTISGKEMQLYRTHNGGTTYRFDDLFYMSKD